MQELSAFPGVTRRDFLKICGGLAVAIGLGQAGAADVAQALEAIAKRPNVVWSDFQECLGCSVNLLQSRTPEVATLILQQISLNYHEAVMAPAGDDAEKSFSDTLAGGDFYWVAEGAIATKIPGAMTVNGKTSMDIAKETYAKAKATIAIGTCATLRRRAGRAAQPDGGQGTRRLPQGGRRRRRPRGDQHVPLPRQRRGPADGAHLCPRLQEAAAARLGRPPEVPLRRTRPRQLRAPGALRERRVHRGVRRRALRRPVVLVQDGLQGPRHLRPLPGHPLERPPELVHQGRSLHRLLRAQVLGHHGPVLLAGAQHRRARHRRRLRLDVHRHPRRARPRWRSARTWSARPPRPLQAAAHGQAGGPPPEAQPAPDAASAGAAPPADTSADEGGE